MEEEDNIIVKWAQEDVEKSYNLLNNNIYGTARQATEENTIRCMRFACCITKATDTHSEYTILIAFPLQLWLHKPVSVLLLYVRFLSCLR